MVKIVNMETVVQLPMIVKLIRYSSEPHNACCLAESHLCLQSRLAATSLQEKAKELYGKDRQYGDGSTISDLMRSPKRSRVRRSKLIAWRRTKLL